MSYQQFEGFPVLGVEDTVFICGKAYAKTKEAALSLREVLEKNYTFNDDKNYASLPHAAQCNSCNSVISSRGVGVHNTACSSCGAYTTQEFVDGGSVAFQFIFPEHIEKELKGRNLLELYVHSYDVENNRLLFYTGLRLTGRFGAVYTEEQLNKVVGFAKEHGFYSELRQIEEDGRVIDLIAIPYIHRGGDREKESIAIHEIYGKITNYKSVKIYDGIPYPEYSKNMPVPTSMTLDETFSDGSKMQLTTESYKTLMRSAGMVDRQDYYSARDSLPYRETVEKRLNAFVENFVDVDFKKWAYFIDNAPSNARNFISELAKWCRAMEKGTEWIAPEVPHLDEAENLLSAFAQALGIRLEIDLTEPTLKDVVPRTKKRLPSPDNP